MVAGARVLDLFAGTGAMGLEALSRGAVAACFVESGAVGLRLLRENLRRARVEARVVAGDATRLGACGEEGYGLVILDPPYGRGLGERALLAAVAGGWVAPGATVLWEEAGPMAAPAGFEGVDQRRYGGTWLTVLRAEGP